MERTADNVKVGAIYNDEAKRQAALRWLSEKPQLHRKTLLVARGAFFVAIATMLVVAIGLLAVLRD